MKICQKCSGSGPFSKDKTRPDGLAKWCKSCMSSYLAIYRKVNKESISVTSREYHQNNSDIICERTKQWNIDNPERRKQKLSENYQTRKAEGRVKNNYTDDNKETIKARSKQWKKDNQGRVNAQLAKRRADIIQATPAWAEINEIIHIYNEARILTETTGIDHEVDHIVPLNSQLVCGLHCLANLQILTAEENNRKKCKLLTEQIDI